MTNDFGRAYVLSRLNDAPTLEALRRVWENLGDSYKRDPIVQKAKDDLKAAMERAGQ